MKHIAVPDPKSIKNNAVLILNSVWFPYLSIAGVILIVYARSLFFQFVGLDDTHLILESGSRLSSFKNIGRAFAADVFWKTPGTYYRPVLNLSLMLDHWWGGPRPYIYHLGNILLHLTASCLLYLNLVKLRYKKHAVLFLALLFAAHPALSQAVAWIPGRNDTLLAVFILLSFYSFRSYLNNGKVVWLSAHVLSFVLALFTKETAVLFPALLVAYIMLSGSEKQGWRQRAALAAGWAASLALWAIMRSMALQGGSGLKGLQLGPWRELLQGLTAYWGKILFPFDLSVLPFPADLSPVYGFLGLGLFLLLALAKGIESKKHFLWGALWFFLFLLPTALRDSPYIHFLEHRLYLPLFGFIIMAMETNFVSRWSLPLEKTLLITGLWLAGWIILSLAHIGVFAGPNAFWGNAGKTATHSYFVHQMRGKLHARQGSWQAAEKEYLLSLTLRPDQAVVYNDLGSLYEVAGQSGKAEAAYLKAADLEPFNSLFYNNLGNYYLNNLDLEKAESYLARSLSLKNDSGEAHANLAMVHIKSGDYPNAKKELLSAASLIPGNPNIYEQLSKVCLAMNMADSAAYYHNLALRCINTTK